jgi:hypothetical protein
MPPSRSIAAIFFGVTLASSAAADEYCTKVQYERDRALIESTISSGTLVKGPKSLRDSILVQEDMWFQMNYPGQIAFMQSFECSVSGGKKKFLYMDVRSLATGKLLATWTLGALKPADGLEMLLRVFDREGLALVRRTRRIVTLAILNLGLRAPTAVAPARPISCGPKSGSRSPRATASRSPSNSPLRTSARLARSGEVAARSYR